MAQEIKQRGAVESLLESSLALPCELWLTWEAWVPSLSFRVPLYKGNLVIHTECCCGGP